MLRDIYQAVLDKTEAMLLTVLGAFADQLDVVAEDVPIALAQMNLRDADGEWLDFHGELYGVARFGGDLDTDYRERIRREVFRQRVNARSLEQIILDETGWDVRIEEPWREMFRMDRSRLSNGDRFYDGDHVGPCLIRPVAFSDNVDWGVVLPLIERNKAAGVVVVDWYSRERRIYGGLSVYGSSPWQDLGLSWVGAHDTWQGLSPVVRGTWSRVGVQATWENFGVRRASPATYVDGGVLKYAGVNEARFQNGVLLIEGAATNSLLQSVDLSSHLWAVSLNFSDGIAPSSILRPATLAAPPELLAPSTAIRPIYLTGTTYNEGLAPSTTIQSSYLTGTGYSDDLSPSSTIGAITLV